MATLQNDDLFLVARGTDNYTIKYEDLLENIGPVPPSGTINTPTVLSPEDGAGSGDERYLESDTITKVEGDKLTVASDKDLSDMTGSVYMTDGQTEADGSFKPASYTPLTSTIASVEDLIINGFDMGGGTVGEQSGGIGTVYSENAVGDIIAITPTGGGGSSINPNVILNNIIDQANQVTFNTNTNSSNTIFECVPTNAIPGGQVVSIQFMISDPDGTVSNTQAHPTINKINGSDILPIKVSGVVIDPVTNYPTGIITFPEGADINNFSLVFPANKIGAGISVWGFTSAAIDTKLTLLTFEDPNPDLQYFLPGDVVQTGVKVISTDTDANTMTVDGGAWLGADGSGEAGDGRYEPSKEWSSLPNTTLGSTNKDIKNCYNGVQGGGAYFFEPNDFEITGFDIDATTVEIYPATGASDTLDCSFGVNNGTLTTVTVTANGSSLDSPVTLNVPTNENLNSIQFAGGIGLAGVGFWKIVVDGKELIDSSIPGGSGDSTVTVGPFTAEGTFLSAVGTEVDLSASSGRWIADNAGDIDFSIAGPVVIDNPLLTADVSLESSLFATTPVGTDTLNNIVWELNGVEQNAGTTNPYKPTLSTNTIYTVRVKHQGNALPESQWSTSTTFTTGATRSIYTYYKERVQLLETRLASIESNEVADDAVDTALLTLIGNINDRLSNLEATN